MFSGLTSQVSSWMGKKEDGSEDPASAAADPNLAGGAGDGTEATDPLAAGSSPTKGSSKLEMLAGVKSQVASSMSGWLSGGIPGLNRAGAATEAGDTATATDADATQATTQAQATASNENVKDDDASRWVAGATGGADSVGPGSLTGTPTEDKDGQQPFGAVSTKALAGAKSLGGFLYSAVNKAGKSVAEAGAKIKKTVEENRLIADLNKEQEAFIASKGGEKGEAQAPWVGSPNEEALKEEILALSTDRRNFVRAPPPGVDFPWDFEAVEPVAQATLALDPNLETMRFELVPKVISEENFWRNYFYRVSLLRQSHEINAMASQQSTESNPTLASNDSVDNAQVRASGSEVLSKETNSTNGNDVRDATTAQQEITDSVKKLDIQSNKEEDWERELEAELKDYEVVPGQEAAKSDWDDGQIDDMLKDEEDLK
ncbi:synapse-associated protein of 47 kDa isoform X1 [Trichogramma pretiosum]|uniref:synapse-associated protein of 47 kDa isoform X1 n=1 Tax=Trichogramma pretiosum TaxID=7493 RepID=UPI0006C9DF9C|nr:synapse-associated protein of 47 kDa isoform X1 [Trichogramma pretiosum]XP_023316304.1 synapse-associated protein of 47 kDa isoform X1 [Trichogramma pretiosum]XP_023316305.1 synapse-associated protein of 47 kDa isoform X1 [Trichogramma pretiosum]